MIYIDSHTHTSFSGDSDTPPQSQIEKAIALGMPAFCITDHQDFDFPPSEDIFTFDTDAYFKKLFQLKDDYKDQIDLRIGVELGLQPDMPTDIASYTRRYPFDFIIGSTHLCRGKDPYYRDFCEDITEEEAYRSYFEDELKNCSSYDCYDVAGHLDYIVRYGPNKNAFYSYQKYSDLLDEILKVLVSRGNGIECNTSGLKSGLGHPHPTEDILRRYRELGGEILTLGSDAHMPDHLGYAFDRIGNLLKDCGFRYYTTFKDRKPEFHPL